MPPILNLSDPADWVFIYNTTLVAASIPTVPPQYQPISAHAIPVTTDRRTLAVGSSSTQTKPTWRLGFFLIVSVQVPGIGKADVISIPIFLGLNLVRIPNYHNSFSLKAKIPKWHKEMTMDIWKYVGTETDS